MARKYSNTFSETTLTGSISNSAITIQVGSTAGLPASFPYTLALDYGAASVEMVTVTALVGSSLTVTRGQDGTSAQSHNSGARVVHPVSARDLSEPQVHIDATSDVHGLSGGASVVGTSQAQTLTNKTISGSNNTLSNIPNTAITAVAASKITQPFASMTVTGAAGAAPVLTVTGDEGARTAPIASLKRGAIGLLVDEDAVVDVSSDLSVGAQRASLAPALTARVAITATTKLGLLITRVVANTQDLFRIVTEASANLFRVDKDGNVVANGNITSGGAVGGVTAAITGAATVGGTLGVTGLTTLSGSCAVTGTLTASTDATANIFNGLADSRVFNVSLPRGVLGGTRYTGAGVISAANAYSTELATGIATPAVNLAASRRYRISVRCQVLGSVDNATFAFHVRDTNAAGAQRGEFVWTNPSAAFGYTNHFFVEYETTAAEAGKVFVVSAIRVGGSGTLTVSAGASGTNTAFIEVEDIGSSGRMTTV